MDAKEGGSGGGTVAVLLSWLSISDNANIMLSLDDDDDNWLQLMSGVVAVAAKLLFSNSPSMARMASLSA